MTKIDWTESWFSRAQGPCSLREEVFSSQDLAFCRTFVEKILYKDFIFGWPTTLYPAAAWSQVLICSQGVGLTIPPLLYLNLLGVGRSQPVIKSLKVGLYARVVILRKNIQARYSMLQKDASNLTLCIGCMCQGVGSGGVLHEWPLWEGIRSYPHIAQSKFQPAPKWIQH